MPNLFILYPLYLNIDTHTFLKAACKYIAEIPVCVSIIQILPPVKISGWIEIKITVCC